MTTYSVTIHSTQVMTAVMSIGTRKMNVNFPYRTTINPAKTTTMIFDAPGYHPYSLVIPPGTDQSYYNIVFTEDPGGNNRDQGHRFRRGREITLALGPTPDGVGLQLAF